MKASSPEDKNDQFWYSGSTRNDGYGNILHRGKQDSEFRDHPPIMRLRYQYKYPLATMAMGYLNKYTWEPRYYLSTIAGVEQVDDDTISYIRRQDTNWTSNLNWERVTINRKDMTMKAETLQKNTDGSDMLIQCHKFWQTAQNQVMNEFLVFQGQDKSAKISLYKKGIANTLKAIKFTDFE
jgi:hypothetical protein